MRLSVLLLILLLGACGDEAGDDSAPRPSGSTVQTADIAGLYETPREGGQRSRMCILSETPDSGTFGLVVETPNGSCSGAGQAVRTGGVLRLTMAGDGECVIDSAVEGTEVTFHAAVGEGCAYYCAPRATLAGAVLEKTGGTAEDAKRATDLAGDPLCG